MAINFDPACAASVAPDTVAIIVEVYSLAGGTAVKAFPTAKGIITDSMSGTLSFNGLNWPWYKRGQTAIAGVIHNGVSALTAFDFQGHGNKPQIVPVYASFGAGIALEQIVFALTADLTMPTDFRAALVFHRSK